MLSLIHVAIAVTPQSARYRKKSKVSYDECTNVRDFENSREDLGKKISLNSEFPQRFLRLVSYV